MDEKHRVKCVERKKQSNAVMATKEKAERCLKQTVQRVTGEYEGKLVSKSTKLAKTWKGLQISKKQLNNWQMDS